MCVKFYHMSRWQETRNLQLVALLQYTYRINLSLSTSANKASFIDKATIIDTHKIILYMFTILHLITLLCLPTATTLKQLKDFTPILVVHPSWSLTHTQRKLWYTNMTKPWGMQPRDYFNHSSMVLIKQLINTSTNIFTIKALG